MEITQRRTLSTFSSHVEAARAGGVSQDFLAGGYTLEIAANLGGRSKPFTSANTMYQAITKATTRGGGSRAVGALTEIAMGAVIAVVKPEADLHYDNAETHDISATFGRKIRKCEIKSGRQFLIRPDWKATSSEARTRAQINLSRPQMGHPSTLIAAFPYFAAGGSYTTSYLVCPMSVVERLWKESRQADKDMYSLAIYFDANGLVTGNGPVAKALRSYVHTSDNLLDAIRSLKAFSNF